MRVKFRVGDVFPSDDPVSQFLTGLAMVVNDVTLVMQHMDRIFDTPEGKSRVNTYYLYLACSYYREAAHFLQLSLERPEVTEFLDKLSDKGKENLVTVRSSFEPWDDSFVCRILKPIRDVVFHYKPWSFDQIEPHLATAANDQSSIELGAGRYIDNRYEFADAVFEEFVHTVWGSSTEELTQILEEMVKLVLALTYFAHEAITLRLDAVDSSRFAVEH